MRYPSLNPSLSAALALLFAATTSARAVPLDAAACDGAKQEQAAMTDVPQLMEHGSEWGKANLGPNALHRVARWIELTELLSFRCGRGVVTAEAQRAAAAAAVLENPPPEPAPPAPATLNPGQATATPQTSPVPTDTAPVAAVTAAATADVPAKPAKKAKPKAKPKPQPETKADGDPPTSVEALPASDTPPPPRKRRVNPADVQAPASAQ